MDLPDPRIELGSPVLQADSLPAELPGNLKVGDTVQLPSDTLPPASPTYKTHLIFRAGAGLCLLTRANGQISRVSC